MAKEMTPDEKAAQQARLLAARKMVQAATEAFDRKMSGEDAMKHVDDSLKANEN